VLYVKTFGGLKPSVWATDVMRANSFTDSDALLAIATDEPAYSFRVADRGHGGKTNRCRGIRRDRIQPAVFHQEWTRAAIAAANGWTFDPASARLVVCLRFDVGGVCCQRCPRDRR